MQDDQLLPYLSVSEAMIVSANLKLGKSFTGSSKKLIVKEIIDSLGLSEAANTQAFYLSGGQRKRYESLTLALLPDPNLELNPTSIITLTLILKIVDCVRASKQPTCYVF